MQEAVRPTTSVAFGADGAFDESKLAKPSDWAALDDFDEESIIAEMTSRVDATWLETKNEVALEKKGGKQIFSILNEEPAPAIAKKPEALPPPSSKPSAQPACKPCGVAPPVVAAAPPPPPASEAGCAVCGAIPKKLKRCTACKSVSYCSRECQVDDWGQHKLVCKQLKEGSFVQSFVKDDKAPAAAAAPVPKPGGNDDLVELD